MRGYRFYREHDSNTQKRQKAGNGNVVAVWALSRPTYPSARGSAVLEGVGAVLYIPNSPVASTGISLDYLRERCTRISEAEARAIHPALFTYLEGGD